MSQSDYTQPTKVTPDTLYDMLVIVFTLSETGNPNEREPSVHKGWKKFTTTIAKRPSFEELAKHFGFHLNESATNENKVQVLSDILQLIRDRLPTFNTMWEITNVRKTHALVRLITEPETTEDPFIQVSRKHSISKPQVKQTSGTDSENSRRNSFELLHDDSEPEEEEFPPPPPDISECRRRVDRRR